MLSDHDPLAAAKQHLAAAYIELLAVDEKSKRPLVLSKPSPAELPGMLAASVVCQLMQEVDDRIAQETRLAVPIKAGDPVLVRLPGGQPVKMYALAAAGPTWIRLKFIGGAGGRTRRYRRDTGTTEDQGSYIVFDDLERIRRSFPVAEKKR